MMGAQKCIRADAHTCRGVFYDACIYDAAFQTGGQDTPSAGNAATSEADPAVDTAMHEASQAALPRAAQAAGDDGAAKERDKPSEPEANRASSLSFSDPIPTEKLRVAAATALSAAAVRSSTSCPVVAGRKYTSKLQRTLWKH